MKKIILIILSAILLDCSKNNDNNIDYTIIAPILDKWWYPYYSGTADFYVHSDGRYEQRDSDTNIIESTGNWILEDENLPIIKINYDEGSEQTLSTVWLYFSEIQEHSLVVNQSNDGIVFGIPSALYQDTDKIFSN